MSSDTSAPPVLPPVRRIVTAHSEDGRSVVKSDTPIPGFELGAVLPGVRVGPVWKTGPLPVKDNNDDTDGALRKPDGEMGVTMKSGTNLQFTDLAPGAKAPLHRLSALDHNILISGKLILEMEDGTEVLLENPGDVVVMRGALHAWRNPGPEWARWMAVLIDAEPAVVNGAPLPPKGLA